MPIYHDVDTDAFAEYPENIGNHPVLGRSLELVVEREEAEAEAKVEPEPEAPVEGRTILSILKPKHDKDND